MFLRRLDTPIGELRLVANAAALVAVLWPDEDASRVGLVGSPLLEDEAHPALAVAVRQLEEYFAGERQNFDLPYAFVGGTEFQRLAWRSLAEIPFGQTVSYGEQARRIQRPKAVRAIGAANGRNPLSIVLPCHRVVGAKGTLTGFAGGLEAKRWLLSFERQTSDWG